MVSTSLRDAVLFSDTDPIIRVDFDYATNHVELWYTTSSDLYLEAYDASNGMIDMDTGNYNVWTNDFMEVNSGSFDIAYVLIHDSGNQFTVDDFGWEEGPGGDPIPEPTTILLLASGLLGLGGISRFRRK